MYPPVATLHRIANKDYEIEPGKTIKEGTGLILSVLGFHHDPKYFPDPHKFDPDRFSPEGKSNRHPFASLEFGKGPRICIGMRQIY